MYKKIESDLVSLAHEVLQMKKKDVDALYLKAHKLYEKLALLKFAQDYQTQTSNSIEEVNDILVEVAKQEAVEEIKEAIVEVKPQQKMEQIIAPPEEEKAIQQESLFENNVSLEKATEILDAPSIRKEVKEKESIQTENQQRSLNDRLVPNHIQIGLNDRIAFVKNLFAGSQEDFNRILSQLNSFSTEKETKDFIQKYVRPEYKWKTKEEYEERFMELIERRFL